MQRSILRSAFPAHVLHLYPDAKCAELVRAFLFNDQSMDHPEASQLDRLIALADEAEQILAKSMGSHDIRHACAVARGYLDLARSYNEPVNVEDVERVLMRMRALLLSDQPERNSQLGSWTDYPGA